MDSDLYVVETTYSIKYTTKKPVPIPEIIDSLSALERTIMRTGPFLEHSYDGLKVVSIEVFIDSLEAGSLTKDFIVKYVFKGEENYNDFKAVVDKVLKDNDSMRMVVAVGVGAVLGAGVYAALPAGSPASHIEAYNNQIITIGASVQLSSDDVRLILDGLPYKKQIAKDAIDIIKPAKSDDSEIIIKGVTGLNIMPDVVEEAPSEYVQPMPSEKSVIYKDARIMIHASDRDRADQGWAGTAPHIVDHRVKLVLGDNVDPKKLHGKTKINADIVVHSRYVKSTRAYEPKAIELTKIK